MRVLYVTTQQRTGGWLAEALAADSASSVVLEEAIGFSAGVAHLRDEVFDAVLISHDPGELDSLALADAMRAGGSDEPLIILGVEPQADMMALCLEAKADAYLCVHDTTTRTLIWVVSRAIEHQRLERDHRKLCQAEQRRIEHERSEAEQQLAEQRCLILGLDATTGAAQGQANSGRGSGASGEPADFPHELEEHYGELLRAYVVMGTGNLASEMQAFAQLLAGARISAAQTLELHVRALDKLLAGLGNRSARHVMNRADLLALEVSMHLCEAYRTAPQS
jgi:DNA-binding NarL/FixJ family response regulator